MTTLFSSLSGYWWHAGFPTVPQVPKVILGSWWVAFPIPQVPQVTCGSLNLLWFLQFVRLLGVHCGPQVSNVSSDSL